MAWRGEPAFPGWSARQVHDFCKVQRRTNRSVRSYVIQGMRMLAVTWANDKRGKSVFWLHTAVRRGIWPSVDDQLGITPRASSDSSGYIFATQHRVSAAHVPFSSDTPS
jgi:hypothetical protein